MPLTVLSAERPAAGQCDWTPSQAPTHAGCDPVLAKDSSSAVAEKSIGHDQRLPYQRAMSISSRIARQPSKAFFFIGYHGRSSLLGGFCLCALRISSINIRRISHTFIRREILALERLGVEVARFALRGWDDECVNVEDRREQERTLYLLRAGPIPLIGALLRTAIVSPGRFLSALQARARDGKMVRPADPLSSRLSGRGMSIAALDKGLRCQSHPRALSAPMPRKSSCSRVLLEGLHTASPSTVRKKFDKPHALNLGEKVRRGPPSRWP